MWQFDLLAEEQVAATGRCSFVTNADSLGIE